MRHAERLADKAAAHLDDAEKAAPTGVKGSVADWKKAQAAVKKTKK